MKKFYENHKKMLLGSVVGVFILVCVLAAGIVFNMPAESKETARDDPPKPVGTASDTVSTKETQVEEEEEVEEVEEVEPASSEPVEPVTEEAAEIVEDSVLDVVETPKPAPAATKETPASTPAPAAPTVHASNMAQNVPFPYEIHVNKQMNCVTVYAMDVNGAYSIPLKAMVCSTGNATPLGTFQTPAKYIWKVLKGNVWGQYSTRITGSILFHSVPYKTSKKDALISKYYNKLGTTASAGCIRLTTIDAKWIYDNCPLGTTVVIYNDSNPGPLGKPSAMKVELSNKWDPTDPDPANPWIGRILRIEGVHDQTIERGSAVDYMAGVNAVDASGNNVNGNVQITTNADPNTAGIYGVHYSVTDALGNNAFADAALTVVDTQAPVFAGIPARIEGRKAADITRELLLWGVTVTDNGQGFPAEWVGVQIPALHDGDNQILYTAVDAAGNQATASTVVYCDMTAPVITKKSDAPAVLALSQQMDQNTALARIHVQDASQTDVNCSLTQENWGYRIDYTAQDQYGNISQWTDHVTYMEYHFTGITNITVHSIEDTAALMDGIGFRDSLNNVLTVPADMQITKTPVSQNTYKVVFRYTYHSPVGSQTADFERMVTVTDR